MASDEPMTDIQVRARLAPISRVHLALFWPPPRAWWRAAPRPDARRARAARARGPAPRPGARGRARAIAPREPCGARPPHRVRSLLGARDHSDAALLSSSRARLAAACRALHAGAALRRERRR